MQTYKYAGLAGFVQFNPSYKSRTIEKINVTITFLKDGVGLNPIVDPLPYAVKPYFRLAIPKGNGGTSIQTLNLYATGRTSETVLGVQIDNYVYVNGDVATIDYEWSVNNTAHLNIASLYTKMYMEQLDANLEMTYIAPNGSAGGVIVPNTTITLPTKKGLSDSGQIKLKLTSKRGYGPRSTRLRITVEWQ